MSSFDQHAHRTRIEKLLKSCSFCVLSTVSEHGRPHAAGVRYVWDGDALILNAHDASRKVRNVAVNGVAAVCIPARKIPFYPSFCIQFQGKADILQVDDAIIQDLNTRGLIKRIVSARDLAGPGQAFLRITPVGNMLSYGIGERLLDIARDPQHAGRSIPWS